MIIWMIIGFLGVWAIAGTYCFKYCMENVPGDGEWLLKAVLFPLFIIMVFIDFLNRKKFKNR